MDNQKIQAIATSIRSLAMDGVQKAKSGHPGLPMGCAEVGAVLFSEVMKHNPADSKWMNRDRFVLSAGHGSMFIYSLLHLSGYDLSKDELKEFRQLGSKTPGHPEYGWTDGVETTTGPLGAGISNAVGMAMAQEHLAAEFNTADHSIIDHNIYVIAGDGCMMEGVASESASLAGHLKLGKLIVIYDSNKITIEGSTDIAFTEDVQKRYEAYGWQTLEGDAHKPEEILRLIEEGKKEKGKPTLITLKSIIGFGSPNKAGTHDVHGAPLGEDEVIATRKNLGIPEDESFYVAGGVYEFFAEKRKEWAAAQDEWKGVFDAWAKANPAKKSQLDLYFAKTDVSELGLPGFKTGDEMATRKASGAVLQSLAKSVPNLIGGSADLAPSNNTNMKGVGDYQPATPEGRNLHFGVREHAMGGIVNGMQLYGGLRVYCATFLVFADYMRPTIRLAAIMGLPVIYVFTHDSIFVGEDGPTHQPVEHAESLRIIPNVNVIRPADAQETEEAWKMALESESTPTALLLTRQNLITFEKADPDWKSNFRKGGYIALDAASPEAVVLATGSEVYMAIEAAKLSGKNVRVVSVTERTILESQDKSYIESLIPEGCPVIATEAGRTTGWGWLASSSLGLNRFGESGPAKKVAEHLGLTAEALAEQIKSVAK